MMFSRSTTPFFLFCILFMTLISNIPLSEACYNNVEVGVYYYVWYEGIYGFRHWNGTPPESLPPEHWTVVDKPLLGWYNSSDRDLIKSHLGMFKHIGIAFALISWWGVNSYSDNATKVIFDVAKNIAPEFNIKLTISVEGCNESGVYDFTYLHNYIFDTYVEPYNSIWMRLNGKPLLTWMETENMTKTQENRNAIHSDDRFENRIIGWSSLVDWYAWFPYRYSSYQEPKLSQLDGFTTIIPRYDETRLEDNRTGCYDETYEEGMYDKQWKKVLEWVRKAKLNFIAIATWNDFTERSQIEPCFDATSFTSDPFYLTEKTQYYIQLINDSYESGNIKNLMYVLIITIVLIAIAIYFAIRKPENPFT